MKETPLYLIDGHAYIFRAYFAIKSMHTPDKRPCNAAFGFFSTLIKFIQTKSPTHALITFDFDVKKSFRQNIDPTYKAQRDDADDDLKRQFSWCIEGAAHLGFPVFMQRGFEADDLIGSLIHQLMDLGLRFVVISPDKDLGQLIGPSVVQWDLAKDKWIDQASIVDRWGVTPNKLADLFGLVGDSVDNIPGVKGIGPKIGAALLQHYENIESIPKDPKAAKSLTAAQRCRAGTLLHESFDVALRSRDLATIRKDVDLGPVDQTSVLFQPNVDAFVKLCQTLGFKGLSERAIATLTSSEKNP